MQTADPVNTFKVLLGERIQPLTLVGFGIIVAGFAPLESREISAELVK